MCNIFNLFIFVFDKMPDGVCAACLLCADKNYLFCLKSCHFIVYYKYYIVSSLCFVVKV